MSSYKVPQDVEAEDKLLGPFSFKQFIYLIIAAGAIGASVFLARIFIPLIIITAPVGLFFLILSLPLKKEQSMEVYLGAILQFWLKPRKKIWQADGIDQMVEFTNIIEEKDSISLKTLNSEQTIDRLNFISNILDTKGWAVKGVLQDSVITAAEEADDVHENKDILENFDRMLSDSTNKHRSDVLNGLEAINQAQSQKPYNNLQPYNYTQNQPSQNLSQITQPPTTSNQFIKPPESFNQAPIPVNNIQNQPNNLQQYNQQITPSLNQISPDIMNLATNEDLSIQTISSEANRLEREREQTKDILGGQNQLEIKLR